MCIWIPWACWPTCWAAVVLHMQTGQNIKLMWSVLFCSVKPAPVPSMLSLYNTNHQAQKLWIPILVPLGVCYRIWTISLMVWRFFCNLLSVRLSQSHYVLCISMQMQMLKIMWDGAMCPVVVFLVESPLFADHCVTHSSKHISGIQWWCKPFNYRFFGVG